MVAWAGLRCVNVVFPDHTHLLFAKDVSEGAPTAEADTEFSSLRIKKRERWKSLRMLRTF